MCVCLSMCLFESVRFVSGCMSVCLFECVFVGERKVCEWVCECVCVCLLECVFV